MATPGWPNVSCPGFFFAHSTTSRHVLWGLSARMAKTILNCPTRLMNVRSRNGSYSTSRRWGDRVTGVSVLQMIVYPSGFAFASSAVATAPAAPGLLMTTTFWPRFFSTPSARARMRMSVAPPGGKPTHTVIGFVGNTSWAAARGAAAPAVTSSAIRGTAAMRESVFVTYASRFGRRVVIDVATAR